MTISALAKRGKCQAQQFIESLSREEQKKVTKRIEFIGHNHPVQNKQVFRHLKGKIWEIKSGPARLLCFQDRRELIITHGFKKEQNKTPKEELKKAESLRIAYLNKT